MTTQTPGLPGEMRIQAGLSNLEAKDYNQPRQELEWEIELPSGMQLWNASSFQRCYLNTTRINTGGNNTDRQYGPKVSVGQYPHCTQYNGYGGPNMFNVIQIQRKGNIVTGWPAQ